MRTRSRQWLVLHGSMLSGADGPDGRAAVVIEPVRPAQIAPVIVAAYKLTGREQDALRLVCQGLGTDQIAQTLFLSPHTVRGYLKDLFARQLVAGLLVHLVARAVAFEVTRCQIRRRMVGSAWAGSVASGWATRPG